MTPDRAKEIVKAINARAFFTMGIGDGALPPLAGVSLAEMVEAAEVVRLANATTPAVDGRRTIHVVPDDRLIAAVYCMEHYPCSNEPIVMVPATRSERFAHDKARKALAIVPIEADAEADDHAEEVA
jgi:hypothetical protein